MPEAYVVGAVRSAIGRRNGTLSTAHPIDLGATVLRSLVERSEIDPAAVDDVILGCLDPIGPQASNIARSAWLAAGLPQQVPGVTIDRQCGSSQQAAHFAAQAVMSGTADLVVAGGVQNMSMVPMLAAAAAGEPLGHPLPTALSSGWQARFGDEEINQFAAAELIAVKWDVSREDMEEYALGSHRRAYAAIESGRFTREIVAHEGFETDETARADTSLEKMATLPTLRPGGRLTAAVSSQISDGASALLVASEAAVRTHGLTPRARIVHLSVHGGDPVLMLTAPIDATKTALARAGLTLEDIDLFEVNEAFASVVMAWLADVGADPARTNVNGGAIALGHPLGATGARLLTSLIHELEHINGRYGLVTMCQGGGQANVTIIERL